jgi:hypothetical protein
VAGPDVEKSISAPSRDGGTAAIASPSPAARDDPAAAATEPSSSSASPRQSAGLPLLSVSDDRRRVAIQLDPRAARAAGVAGAAGTVGAAGNGEQARCGRATGILREPRVYTSGTASRLQLFAIPCNPACDSVHPACNPTRSGCNPVCAGAASIGGDSASTDNEIMSILPTNASLGARVPRPLTPDSD